MIAAIDAGTAFLIGCACGALLIGFIYENAVSKRGERRRPR